MSHRRAYSSTPVEVVFQANGPRYAYRVEPPVTIGDTVVVPPAPPFRYAEADATVVSLHPMYDGSMKRARVRRT